MLGIIAACPVCPPAAPAEHMELVAEAEDSFSPAGHPTPCLSHEYPCGLGICLNASLVCSGQQDCADGSDEGGNCSLPCQRPCSQLCYPSPQGPVSAGSCSLGVLPNCDAVDWLQQGAPCTCSPYSVAGAPQAISWLKMACPVWMWMSAQSRAREPAARSASMLQEPTAVAASLATCWSLMATSANSVVSPKRAGSTGHLLVCQEPVGTCSYVPSARGKPCGPLPVPLAITVTCQPMAMEVGLHPSSLRL